MSQDAVEQQRRNIQEFLQVLPLTLALAGLPGAPGGTYFNDGQLEARSTAIRSAYKQARQLLRAIAKG